MNVKTHDGEARRLSTVVAGVVFRPVGSTNYYMMLDTKENPSGTAVQLTTGKLFSFHDSEQVFVIEGEFVPSK